MSEDSRKEWGRCLGPAVLIPCLDGILRADGGDGGDTDATRREKSRLMVAMWEGPVQDMLGKEVWVDVQRLIVGTKQEPLEPEPHAKEPTTATAPTAVKSDPPGDQSSIDPDPSANIVSAAIETFPSSNNSYLAAMLAPAETRVATPAATLTPSTPAPTQPLQPKEETPVAMGVSTACSKESSKLDEVMEKSGMSETGVTNSGLPEEDTHQEDVASVGALQTDEASVGMDADVDADANSDAGVEAGADGNGNKIEKENEMQPPPVPSVPKPAPVIFDFEKEEVPFEKVDPATILAALRSVSSLQIIREVQHEPAVRLQGIVGAVNLPALQAVIDAAAARGNQPAAADLLRVLPNSVLDVDPAEALGALAQYRDAVARQRKARVEAVRLVKGSRCRFRSEEGAAAFDRATMIATRMERALTEVRDAMELEGLDVEADGKDNAEVTGAEGNGAGDGEGSGEEDLELFEWYEPHAAKRARVLS